MRLLLIIIALASVHIPSLCEAVELRLQAVKPAVVNRGESVQITGTGFTGTTTVILGGQTLTPRRIGEDNLELEVPQLPEGEYVLQLSDNGVLAAQSLSVRIESPPPTITSLTPTNIDECSTTEERLVTIRGRGFKPGASLLLNGSVISAIIDNELQISFTAPHLDAGIYGLEVVNPDSKRSLPESLYFNNIPKIHSLSLGDDYVNYYQIIIIGKNFYPQSALVVRDTPSGFGDQPPQQKVIHAHSASQGSAGSQRVLNGDYLNYVDCNTLIYYRYPYSGQDRELRLQVVNQDGKNSNIEVITSP